MQINRAQIRTFSMLGQRGTFGVALTEFADTNDDIVALTADLCNTSGLDRFKERFPERLINVGIAEQNMVGIAAGLAACGNIPFATTFSNFLSLRSCEQIRHFLGYMRENVKLVGFGSGFAMGMFGNTHYGIEDIAAIRAIENIIILSPADALEVYKCVQAAIYTNSPVYIRLSGLMNNPIVYKEDYEFEIGKAVTIKDGEDVAIIATGSMVDTSLKAAKLLEDNNISAKVINVHTIKPLDVSIIKEACSTKLIVTVEEHSVTGGLGSAVAELLANVHKKPEQIILGISEGYKPAGMYQYMLEQNGLTKENIAKIVIDNLKGD